MPTTVTKSIGTSSRDYSTLQAWEDATPADLTSSDQIWRGEAYNDSEFSDAGVLLDIGGTTTDATRYVELTAAAGQSFQDAGGVRSNALRYNQSNGVGVRKTGLYGYTIRVNTVQFTRISRLQIKSESSLAMSQTGLTSGTIRDVLADANSTAAVIANDGTCDYRNVVAVTRNASGDGFQLGHGSTLIGCTAIRPSDISAAGAGFAQSGYGTDRVIQSCASFGFTNAYSGAGWDTTNSKNNASDAGSLPGSSNQTSVTYSQFTPFTDADKDSLDLRSIAATSLAANGFLDGTNAPNDISGTARANPPTIGHWEIVSAGGFTFQQLTQNQMPITPVEVVAY